MATRLHILDGAKSIGGTKMILEEDGRGVILDFGLNYGRLGLFFDEFLKPRSGRGILDYILTGLLPGYRDLYRQDIFIDHPGLADLPDRACPKISPRSSNYRPPALLLYNLGYER